MAYTTQGGLILPDAYRPPTEDIEQSYGEGGRRVSTRWNVDRQTYYQQVQPDANGSLRLTKIDAKRLMNRPVKEVVRTLAKAAASMSDAIDLWRQYINSGHYWETESTADERRLKGMEMRVTQGGTSFQTIINQFVFGQVVEGAVCGEVTGNKVEGITQIDAVSPFEITFVQEDDPRKGPIDIIGQGVGGNFRVLQDPRKPNPYFVYDPVSNDSTEAWGSIPFLPGISAEIMHSELFTKTDQYLDGQIFPKGYFSFDMSAAAQAGINPDQIVKWVNDSLTDLQSGLNDADPTQAVISRLPLIWSIIGTLGKVNLEGLEMLDKMISRNLGRAYKVPGFLFDLGSTNSLNSTRERNEMLLWLRRVRNFQRMNEEAFTQWGNIELQIQGSRNKCQFRLDDTDLEGERLIAEVDQLQATARNTQAQADATNIKNGVISREEARITLVASDDRYKNLDPNKVPEMEPEPESDDNMDGNTGSQGDE